ncbi:MAG: tRNA threonylcarbamoyladenosine dehydratase [Myxococcales bacterium]|nr:tRNA threonylcarbamoyladenosine dehydratase [Myxococcales bacterium]
MPKDRAPEPPVGAPGGAPGIPVGDDEKRYRTHRRFDRAARLFGEPGLHRLMDARVIIFGAGGVGSFTAEALARSGLGHLTLVDFDQVCVTNTNRQLHALRGNIGKNKVDVMAERLRLVHPTSTIEAVPQFYNAENSDALLSGPIDFVVDAIDNMTAKAHLIATCVERGIPLVSSMGAAARLDPTKIRVDDIAHTEIDPFARALRKILRKVHGLGKDVGKALGVPAVYSTEPPLEPLSPTYDEGQGFRCVCPNGQNNLHTCEKRNRIDGSAAFVTGAFGLAAAGVVVRTLAAR